VAAWQNPEAASVHREWSKAVIAAASEASTGRAYVNYLGDRGTARTAYGQETYRRLVSLKDAYDPTNVFRLNQNIEPTQSP
jgi:FAD/FMN-containing dehydrogenase